MELLTSKVPRTLETKAKLFGFDLADLLIIFMYLSVTNLMLGETSLKFPVVWGGTALLAAAFRFLKKGKPDNYLEHGAQYLTQPRIFSAARMDLKTRPLPALNEGTFK
jgi:hypothetical protein